ncbi:hypothetical protein KRR26_06460 [Corallococcus sp. M34]|uniref:hypothetical protein n=1 Tax=Citreicoccus inhibens TaxID=2849499 RepID=UPI0011C42EBD|nr:hypothetical protein [Citreicoccus inhibens]MBU8895239.1 hypothetical protein [Citreicoccus inhibens]
MSATAEYRMLDLRGGRHLPPLRWEKDEAFCFTGKGLFLNSPILLGFAEPAPRAAALLDGYGLPEPVVSPQVKNALEPLELFATQFVPADVQVASGLVRYWLLHVWNRLEWKSATSTGPDAPPLEKRLLFRLKDAPSVYLFHVSLVERLTPLRLAGLLFRRCGPTRPDSGGRVADHQADM